MEINALVSLVVIVVFLLVVLLGLYQMYRTGNIFSGDNSICEGTWGWIRGCS